MFRLSAQSLRVVTAPGISLSVQYNELVRNGDGTYSLKQGYK